MKKQIFLCVPCQIYTMKEICPNCNKKTENPRPAKYSVDDKFGKYRRLAKKDLRLEKPQKN